MIISYFLLVFVCGEFPLAFFLLFCLSYFLLNSYLDSSIEGNKQKIIGGGASFSFLGGVAIKNGCVHV